MQDDNPTNIRALDNADEPAAKKRQKARHRDDDVTLPAELGDAVGFQIRRATGVADALFADTFGDLEINAAQYALLMVVRHNPGCPTAAAGSLVGIAPNNFVPLLDSLTARGYIRRTPSSTDRRVRHLRLTPRGEIFCAALVERHEAIQAKIEERMGHGSVAEFLRLLTLYCSA